MPRHTASTAVHNTSFGKLNWSLRRSGFPGSSIPPVWSICRADQEPHLIPLPANPYEVAEMVYRTVDVEGFVNWRGNRYSVPWQTTRPGQMLPVKINEDELIVYGTQIDEIARHTLFPVTVTGQKREEKSHRPPRDQQRRQQAL
jgi:hypothetical protein